MARHRDYYERRSEVVSHNHAPSFPQQEGGDSWVGALCGRHNPETKARFGTEVFAVLCENSQCPATCSVCNMEFQPRKQAQVA